ncbi:YczE/YyaS/YitT family protein [Aquibacillus kalidii]|uniref:YczE/YyaS/YitT family protein n=1 Tax=Aquibacillus kalidii TaxID=2762597 RepID=UPI001648F943|nr:YitT family protein [Aquibacillus kalidii]
MSNKREYLIRWLFFFAGIIILAFGVSLTIKAKDLGLSPWDVFHYGLYIQFGLTIGTWSIITGLIIVMLTAYLTKKLPTIGTYLNMILLGLFIDLFNWLIPEPNLYWTEVVLLILGIFITAIGVGVYVAPNFGAGPRDSVMLYMSKRFGWKLSRVRNAIELVVFVIGWLLGGPIGVGTIVIVLSIGSVVGVTIPQAEQFLNNALKRGVRDENLNKRKIWTNHYD